MRFLALVLLSLTNTESALSPAEKAPTFEKVEGLGHEWKFWDIELQKFLDYAGLPVVK